MHTEQAEQTKCLQAVVENLRSEVDALTGAIDDLKASAADRERRIVEHMEKRIREETEPRVRAPF